MGKIVSTWRSLLNWAVGLARGGLAVARSGGATASARVGGIRRHGHINRPAERILSKKHPVASILDDVTLASRVLGSRGPSEFFWQTCNATLCLTLRCCCMYIYR